MREFPKIRKTIKWGGVAVAALACAARAISVRLEVHYSIGMTDFSLTSHRVKCTRFVHISDGLPPGMHFFPASPAVGRWFAIRVDLNPVALWIEIPLWLLAVAGSAAALLAWRKDRLAERLSTSTLCWSCRYDRDGLSATSPCPECGVVPVMAKLEPTTEDPPSSARRADSQ